jgi:GT2 family glycosyltransferase
MDENLGFAKANNEGIKVARGRNILLLNSDTIVIRDAVVKLLSFIDSNHKVGIVGCRVLNFDRSLQYTCFHYPDFVTELLFFTKNIIKDFWDPFQYHKYMKYWKYNKTRKVDSISGCIWLVKREVFDQCGLLDGNFFMYYEDAEFCKRISDRYEVFFYPQAEIIHLKGKSAENVNFLTLGECFKSANYYFKKYYGNIFSKLFEFSCKSIWCLEIFILFFLRRSPKANKKYTMLLNLVNL